MKSDLPAMLHALFPHDHLVEDWQVYGSEGLRLSVPSKEAGDALADAIAADLETQGWHLDIRRSRSLSIEPDLNEEVNLQRRRYLFHVASRQARDAIAKEGLRLSKGGTTRLGRSYPPRVHLALHFESALAFIHFQCSSPSGLPEFTESDFDIWRVAVDPEGVYRHDLHFVGEAVWTDKQVPPDRLRRITGWQVRRRILHLLTGSGVRTVKSSPATFAG